MVSRNQDRIHSKSFHHLISEGGGHLINDQQFLGIDPFDHSKFKKIYATKRSKISNRSPEEEK